MKQLAKAIELLGHGRDADPAGRDRARPAQGQPHQRHRARRSATPPTGSPGPFNDMFELSARRASIAVNWAIAALVYYAASRVRRGLRQPARAERQRQQRDRHADAHRQAGGGRPRRVAVDLREGDDRGRDRAERQQPDRAGQVDAGERRDAQERRDERVGAAPARGPSSPPAAHRSSGCAATRRRAAGSRRSP